MVTGLTRNDVIWILFVNRLVTAMTGGVSILASLYILWTCTQTMEDSVSWLCMEVLCVLGALFLVAGLILCYIAHSIGGPGSAPYEVDRDAGGEGARRESELRADLSEARGVGAARDASEARDESRIIIV